MDSKTEKQLRDLAREAEKQKDLLFVVGGTLRDRKLGREFRDIDLVCADAAHWSSWFTQHIRSTRVVLHNEPGQEVFRVPVGRQYYCDFCTRQGKTIEEDLANRDFTINALAQPLADFLNEKNELKDQFNGVQDLKDRIIRVLPGNPFEDDPLRMLRAYRQAAVLGFSISSDTVAAIKENAFRINLTSSERISQELLLLLSTWHPNIPGLLSSGLLSQLMNKAGINFQNAETLIENWKHYQTFWTDSHCPLHRHKKYYQDLLDNNDKRAQFGISLLFSHLDSKAAKKFMELYRFSNRQTERVVSTVQLWQVFHQYWEEYDAQPPETLLYKWCTNCEETFLQTLLLAALSVRPRTTSYEKWSLFLETGFDFYTQKYLPATSTKPLISGNDLQELFNLTPSPLFKTLLGKIREAQVLGEVATREQAEDMMRQLIKTSKDPT